LENLGAVILGSLHLVYCVVFFVGYFSSNDPEKSMGLILLVPVDPWIVPLSKGIALSDQAFAATVIGAGTIQWLAIGWLLGRATAVILKRGPNKAADRMPGRNAPDESGRH
jgi:hypothetical protein